MSTFDDFMIGEATKQNAEIQTLQNKADYWKGRFEELAAEFAILSRACGNWREWGDGVVSPNAPDYMHSDWKAATRAILERNTLRDRLPVIIADWERDSKKYPPEVRVAYLFCSARLKLLMEGMKQA